MRIAIIGSTQYSEKFAKHKEELVALGHDVATPAFDDHPEFDELGICAYNLYIIEQADVIHVIWDGRSSGTIFDLGMCFALRKPIKLIYVEPKSFRRLFAQYEELSNQMKNEEGIEGDD